VDYKTETGSHMATNGPVEEVRALAATTSPCGCTNARSAYHICNDWCMAHAGCDGSCEKEDQMALARARAGARARARERAVWTIWFNDLCLVQCLTYEPVAIFLFVCATAVLVVGRSASLAQASHSPWQGC
jgi:hypothetical protein